jgi:hypothetical protein
MPRPSPWWKKLTWFLALWCAGVAAVALAAFIIRLAMRAAGLNS